MPLSELDLCPMAFTQWLGVDVWGVGFVACDRNCTGAAITDAFIAIHALVFALRVLRLGGAAGPLRRAGWCQRGAKRRTRLRARAPTVRA